MQIFRDYAMSFLGLPYKWGGDDPIRGFDCSGLVIELYQSLGLLPRGYDGSAQAIYDKFQNESIHESPGIGALVFYGESVLNITHVAMLLENTAPWRVIEAGGGGSVTTDKELASDMNAYIKIRPINYRKDKVAILKPLYFASKP